MLKKLLRKLKGFFQGGGKAKDKGRSKPTVSYGDKVGNVLIERAYQLDKHTAFKPGESYRVGEMIVTVHATKESMLAAIAAVDAKREAHHAALTKRAEDIMLMTPEQLEAFQIEEWLSKRKKKHEVIQGKMGIVGSKRYQRPEELPPDGTKAGRFKQLTANVKNVQKVP